MGLPHLFRSRGKKDARTNHRRYDSSESRTARSVSVFASADAVPFLRPEGLQICQLGFDLQPGDEVLTTGQDYPRMLTTFDQRARRAGIVLRTFPLHPSQVHTTIPPQRALVPPNSPGTVVAPR